MQRLVIIGNGMAAARLVAELARLAPGRHAITIIGDEPGHAYNRMMLSAVLAGELAADGLALHPADWWDGNAVSVRAGAPAAAIDPAGRHVRLGDGTAVAYDTLVIATGSTPVRLPVPGSDLGGVVTFRTLEDVAAMRLAATPGVPVVVVGGGLLGIEAAYGMAQAGADVALVHVMDRLMERQLDAAAAAMLRTRVAALGIRVMLGAATARFEGDAVVQAVTLADGTRLPAALVVLAVGVRPNTALAQAAGIATERGILVDDCLRTDAPGIHALGECAQHRGATYGLVAPVYEQAAVLAAHLAGEPASYAGSMVATHLKVSGVPVFSAGAIEGNDCITVIDRAAGIYRKLVLEDGRLAGAVLCGDTEDAAWYGALIAGRRDITAMRHTLAFGPGAAEPIAA